MYAYSIFGCLSYKITIYLLLSYSKYLCKQGSCLYTYLIIYSSFFIVGILQGEKTEYKILRNYDIPVKYY